MHQLQALNEFKKHLIISFKSIYLGDIYVHLDNIYYTIRNGNDSIPIKLLISEEYTFIPNKEYVIDYLRCNFFGSDNIKFIGCGNIYLDRSSNINDSTLNAFKSIERLFISLNKEYDNFIADINSML